MEALGYLEIGNGGGSREIGGLTHNHDRSLHGGRVWKINLLREFEVIEYRGSCCRSSTAKTAAGKGRFATGQELAGWFLSRRKKIWRGGMDLLLSITVQ